MYNVYYIYVICIHVGISNNATTNCVYLHPFLPMRFQPLGRLLDEILKQNTTIEKQRIQ